MKTKQCEIWSMTLITSFRMWYRFMYDITYKMQSRKSVIYVQCEFIYSRIYIVCASEPLTNKHQHEWPEKTSHYKVRVPSKRGKWFLLLFYKINFYYFFLLFSHFCGIWWSTSNELWLQLKNKLGMQIIPLVSFLLFYTRLFYN